MLTMLASLLAYLGHFTSLLAVLVAAVCMMWGFIAGKTRVLTLSTGAFLIGAPVAGILGLAGATLSGRPAAGLALNLTLLVGVPAAVYAVWWLDRKLAQVRAQGSHDG